MTLPSPSESYWTACGGPPVEGTDDLPPGSVCAACGGVAVRGMTMARWSGAGSLVLDKLKAPHSPYACRGCVWACTWAAPPGRAAKEGQTKGPSPAMYAHVLEWTPDGPRYANASKGEKPAIRAWLAARREHPWWMVVADMGKKQLIPWADWNLAPTARGATRGPPGWRRGGTSWPDSREARDRSPEPPPGPRWQTPWPRPRRPA